MLKFHLMLTQSLLASEQAERDANYRTVLSKTLAFSRHRKWGGVVILEPWRSEDVVGRSEPSFWGELHCFPMAHKQCDK